jgi:hypothetical protein
MRDLEFNEDVLFKNFTRMSKTFIRFWALCSQLLQNRILLYGMRYCFRHRSTYLRHALWHASLSSKACVIPVRWTQATAQECGHSKWRSNAVRTRVSVNWICLYVGKVAVKQRRYIWRPIWRVSKRILQTVLPSVNDWTSLLQSAGALSCQSGPAQRNIDIQCIYNTQSNTTYYTFTETTCFTTPSSGLLLSLDQ